MRYTTYNIQGYSPGVLTPIVFPLQMMTNHFEEFGVFTFYFYYYSGTGYFQILEILRTTLGVSCGYIKVYYTHFCF